MFEPNSEKKKIVLIYNTRGHKIHLIAQYHKIDVL